MQSFLDINLENCGNCIKSVPETFVLGPFLHGLNDPIHHKEFGKCFTPLAPLNFFLFIFESMLSFFF